MSAINSFAKSGFWDYRNAIVPAVIAAPLAIEGAILAKNVYQNPQAIKEKCIQAKKWVIQSLTPQKGEKRNEAILRIAKNILTTLACLSLMAGAVYLSVLLLPTAMAISTAIAAVYLIGKLFINAKSYKKQIVEAFTAKEGEDPEVARKRIRKTVIKTAVFGILAIGAIAVGIHILIPLFTKGFSWSVALPYQTKGVVFAEYAAVGLLNGYMAYSKYQKGDKLGALFSVFAGALSFLFPFMYWNNEMRLHHSFYGLLMMASPFRATQFLGSVITFDSSLYFLQPLRGYSNGRKFVQYDFINSIVDNFSAFYNGYAAALLLGDVNDNFPKREPAPQSKDPIPT